MKKLLLMLSLLFCFNLSLLADSFDLKQIKRDLPEFKKLEINKTGNEINGNTVDSWLGKPIYILIQKSSNEKGAKKKFDEYISYFKSGAKKGAYLDYLTDTEARFMVNDPKGGDIADTYRIVRRGLITVRVKSPTALVSDDSGDGYNSYIYHYFATPFNDDFNYKDWLKD